MSKVIRVIAALFMVFAISPVLIAPRAFAYPGESGLEKLEMATFNWKTVPTARARWKRPRVLEYITSTYRRTPDVFILHGPNYGSGCWQATGKAVCGEYDPKHHLLAFFHNACCNGIMYLATAPAFKVPTADLSDIRTTTGLRIDSSAAEVVRNLGSPTIFREAGGSRVIYAYDYPPSGRSCEAHLIEFVLNADRVIAIKDISGC